MEIKIDKLNAAQIKKFRLEFIKKRKVMPDTEILVLYGRGGGKNHITEVELFSGLKYSLGDIDAMDYEQMLRIWRFADSGHELVSGDLSGYFAERFYKLRDECKDSESISKRVGWK